MSTIALSGKQLRYLRSRAHELEPRLSLGKQGLSDTFRSELEAILNEQELVKLRVGKRVEIDLKEMAASFGAVLVQKVGRTFVLYRPASEPVIQLPA